MDINIILIPILVVSGLATLVLGALTIANGFISFRSVSSFPLP